MITSEKSKHVYSHGTGFWWFSDEAEQEHGPFDTEEIALEQFTKYCEWLNG